MKNHVLFVSHLHDLHGGAERALLENIRSLVRSKKFTVDVILPHSGEFSEQLEKDGIPYSIIPSGWSGHTLTDTRDFSKVNFAIQNTDTLVKVYDFLLHHRPDIVITNTITVPWTAYIAKEMGIPTVLNICELYDSRNNISLLPSQDEQMRLIRQTFDFIVYNSHYTKDTYEDMLSTIPSIIDYPPIRAATVVPAALTMKKNTVNIIVPGTIARPKNQLEVIEALDILQRKHPSIELSLSFLGQEGDKVYAKELHHAINNAHLNDRVHFLGYKQYPYDFISQHDIVVIPSTHEAFGMVTVESLLLGRVVIGADAGGTKEIINETTGYLYKSGVAASLAETLFLVTKKRNEAQNKAHAAQVYAQKTFINKDYTDVVTKIIAATLAQRRNVGISTFNPLIASLLRNEYVDGELANYSQSLSDAASRLELLEQTVHDRDATLHDTQLEIKRLHERSLLQLLKDTVKQKVLKK